MVVTRSHCPAVGVKLSRKTSLLFLLAAFAAVDHSRAASPIFPRALRPGDTITFVAPARPLDRSSVDLACERLRMMGFRVQLPKDLFRRRGYLAGSDAERAGEVMAAFKDPSVDAIFPGTGGFGTTRLLDLLDYDVIRRHPKVLIGFSDITGLHLAIHKKTGLVTFHSPNPDGGLGQADNLSTYSSYWFFRAILAGSYPRNDLLPGYLISARVPDSHRTQRGTGRLERPKVPVAMVGGIARGRLIGGNLSLITSLMGTPYEIETAGRVLFLEDIGEAPYRVDRMLSTMRLAGKFDELSGVVLGRFTRRATEDTTGEHVTIEDVLRDYFAKLGVPVIYGFPVGHHRFNATLPIGVMVEVNAEAGSIQLLENPVRCGEESSLP